MAEDIEKALTNVLDYRNSLGFDVTFRDVNKLSALKDLLIAIRDGAKASPTEQKIADTVTTLANSTKQLEKTAKDNGKKQDEVNGNLEKVADKINKAADKIDETNKNWGRWVRIINATIDGIEKGMDITKEMTAKARVYAQTLSDSGVMVNTASGRFIDVLNNTGNDLGLTMDSVTKLMASNSERLAKFSANGIDNNIKLINDSMKIYQDHNLLSAKSAQSIMQAQMDILLKYSTSAEIQSTNIQTQSDKLAQQFIKLSMVTGKSVEQLVQEQQQKERNAKYDVWKKDIRNEDKDAQYRSAGLNEDARVFLATGKLTSQLQLQMARNQSYGKALQEMRRDNIAGRAHNIASINKLFDEAKISARQNTQYDSAYASSEWMDAGAAAFDITKLVDVNKINKEQLNNTEQSLYVKNAKAIETADNRLANMTQTMSTVNANLDANLVNIYSWMREQQYSMLKNTHDIIPASMQGLQGGIIAAIQGMGMGVVGGIAESITDNVTDHFFNKFFGKKGKGRGKIGKNIASKGKLGNISEKIANSKIGKDATSLMKGTSGKVIGALGKGAGVVGLGLNAYHFADDLAHYGSEGILQNALTESARDNFLGLFDPTRMAYSIEALTYKGLNAMFGPRTQAQQLPAPNNQQPKTVEELTNESPVAKSVNDYIMSSNTLLEKSNNLNLVLKESNELLSEYLSKVDKVVGQLNHQMAK